MLANGPAAPGRILPDIGLLARHGQLGTGFGRHDAGIDGETFALDQTGRHAGAHHLVKDPAERLALPEAPETVLGKSRMVGHRDRKSTRLNSSHHSISYAVFCLK